MKEILINEKSIRKYVKTSYLKIFLFNLVFFVLWIFPRNGFAFTEHSKAVINAVMDQNFKDIPLNYLGVLWIVFTILFPLIILLTTILPFFVKNKYHFDLSTPTATWGCSKVSAIYSFQAWISFLYLMFTIPTFYLMDSTSPLVAIHLILCVLWFPILLLFPSNAKIMQKTDQMDIDQAKDSNSPATSITETEVKANTPKTPADLSALLEYKKLLDDGVITQEEFDQKKKELLNL